MNTRTPHRPKRRGVATMVREANPGATQADAERVARAVHRRMREARVATAQEGVNR